MLARMQLAAHCAARYLSALIASATAALALVACGGGDDGTASDVASMANATDNAAGVGTEGTDTGVSSGVGDTGDSTVADPQEAMLAYTECLRGEGLDVDDPTFDAEGNLSGPILGPDSGIDPSSADFQAAQAQCESLMEGVPFGGRRGDDFDIEAMQQASLSFTQCLRDEGFEVDDLDFSTGGMGGAQPGTATAADGSTPAGGLGAGPGQGGQAQGGPGQGDPSTRLASVLGLDPDDPAVAAALDTCDDVLEAPMNGDAPATTASDS